MGQETQKITYRHKNYYEEFCQWENVVACRKLYFSFNKHIFFYIYKKTVYKKPSTRTLKKLRNF